MMKSNLQCLYWIALLCIHLPLRPCLHDNLCIGHLYQKQGHEHSIGDGTRQYHRYHDLVFASHYGNTRCFETARTYNNTYHPAYINYKSTDFADTTDDGSTLFGWLSVSIVVARQFDMFAIQSFVPSRKGQYTPGEIVTTRLGGDCQGLVGEDPYKKVNLAPCYYSSNPSPTVSVAGAFQGRPSKFLRFTYRTDFPECSPIDEANHLEFRFYASRDRPVVNDDCGKYVPMFTVNQVKIFVRDTSYGAYDPEPPRQSNLVECRETLYTGRRWVKRYEGMILTDQGTPTSVFGHCTKNVKKSSSFSGRCNYINADTAIVNQDVPYQCPVEIPQKNHTNEYEPENPAGGSSCGGCEGARNITREYGMACGSAVGKSIWGLRSTHGIAMAWTAMVVIPLSTLLSRYYKETHMRHRYVNMHVWHGVHAAAACTGFAGLLSGWVAALVGRLYFGFSKNGVG